MKETLINKIINGDCIKELKKIPTNSVDLIFADPPYNLQLQKSLNRPDNSKVSAVTESWDKFKNLEAYDNFSKSWLYECKRVMKNNGALWVIGTYHNIFRLGSILQDLKYWILNDIIWNKTNPMPNFKGTRFTNSHETLIWALKEKNSKYTFNYQSMKCFNDDIQMRSDWNLPICNGSERLKKEGKKIHPTQKPESLLYRIIISTTQKGDLILDPFFGTGTTGVVAKKLGRNYLGIEQNKQYIVSAERRIKQTHRIQEFYTNTIENKKNKKRVPFGSLIENKIIEPGTKIFDQKKRFEAIIRADGSIACQNITGSIHKVAAKIQGTESCNGWTFWYLNMDGKNVLIDNLRNEIHSQMN